MVLRSNGTTQDYLYLHRDYQGTILAISNAQGAVVEKRLFDAWGQLVNVEDGKGNVLSKMMVLDRGYTGHEHLQSVGLVHMNGRLYDAKLHRFLQPDNFVQDPYNTQNFNRYVLNNPLKYTDPTGEFTWSDLFAAVEIVVGAALVIFSAGTLATLGGALIVSGFTHFASTYNEYKQTGNWDAASINAGVMFGIQLETDWGYNKPKNGIGQQDSNSINNPKPDTNTNTNTGTQNGGNGNGNGGSVKGDERERIFYGVDIRILPYMQSGSYFMGGINVPQSIWDGYEEKGLNSYEGRFLMHEYGHFLQNEHGGSVWYLYPALSSIIDSANSNQFQHSQHWAEIQASTMAYYFFGFPKNFREENNPINPNFLSLELRKKLYDGYKRY